MALVEQCAGPSKSTSFLKQGKMLYEQGQYDQAITELKTELDSHPESADLKYYLGLSYLQTGNYSEAFDWYNQAVKLDTNLYVDSVYSTKLTQYAEQLKNKDKFDQSVAWADTAINFDQQNWRAYYVKYMSQGLKMYNHADRWGLWDAIVVFGKAAEMQDNEPMPYYYMAKSYQTKNDKDFDNIIEAYQKALDRDPKPAIRQEIEANLKELKRRKKLYEDFWGN